MAASAAYKAAALWHTRGWLHNSRIPGPACRQLTELDLASTRCTQPCWQLLIRQQLPNLPLRRGQPFTAPTYALLLHQWLLVHSEAGGAEQRLKHLNVLFSGKLL